MSELTGKDMGDPRYKAAASQALQLSVIRREQLKKDAQALRDAKDLALLSPNPLVRELLGTIIDAVISDCSGSQQSTYVSTGVQLPRAQVQALLAVAGVPERPLAYYGDCATCIFGPKSRGYGSPCVSCTGSNHSCHLKEGGLLDAE